MPEHFDPHSNSAMFATLLEKLENIKQTVDETKIEVKKTNGRVSTLENWKATSQAKAGVIAAVVTTVISIMIWIGKTFVS
jgi:uncharacterized protein (DUF2225 family)